MKKLYSLCTVTNLSRLLRRSLLTLMALFVAGSMVLIEAQTLTTDQYDYLPGDIVDVEGEGWQPFEVINFSLDELVLPVYRYLDPLLDVTSVICNDDGEFSARIYSVKEKDLGGEFLLTASGSSGTVITTRFIDGGGDYSIDFSAYKPELYLRAFPGTVPLIEGRGSSPLYPTNYSETVEALNPEFLGLGQIVAFEFYITVKSTGVCSNDIIEFTPRFSTQTTSKGPFGFDPDYGVYAAFVDVSAGGGLVDPDGDATVTNITTLPNTGYFEGNIQVSGLDPGDVIPVEVWVVLQRTFPPKATGNVASYLMSAVTAGTCEPGENISVGNQTISLLQVGTFESADVDVSVAKIDTPDPVSRCSELVYTIAVTNNIFNSNAAYVANDIIVTDVLDANTTFQSWSDDDLIGSDWSLEQVGQTLTFRTAYLNPGETANITVRVTVNSDAPIDGTNDLTNTVSVTTISDDINLDNNSDTEYTDVIYNPVISLVKEGILGDGNANGLPDVGETINYTFTVTNTGDVPLTNVLVTDPLITVNGGPITLLNPGAVDNTTFSGSYIITQDDINAGKVDNTATVTGYDPCNAEISANDSWTVTLSKNASLTIVKTADPTTYDAVGDEIGYSYLVTNTGNVTLYDVYVTDDKATTSPATVATLAPGASTTFTATYTITQADLDAGFVTNTAYASDGTTSSDPDSETVTLNNLPPSVTCPEMPVITPCSQTVSGLAAQFSDPNNNIVSLTWTMTGATIASSPATGINNLDTYTFGWGTTTVTYTVTDALGLTDFCSFTVTITPCETNGNFCTYTQGFYGNTGGLTCDGQTALDLMNNAFWNGITYEEFVDFGAGAKVFRLKRTDVINGSVFNMLPGGGKPAPLKGFATYSQVNTWSNVPLSTKKSTYGTIGNGLLSQTMVLWFNMRNDPALTTVTIDNIYIITADSECKSDEPLPGTELYTKFPSAILDYFGGEVTVGELFELANKMLGGQISTKIISPSAIEQAVDAINNAFDECRVYIGTSDYDPTMLYTDPAIDSQIISDIKAGEFSEVDLTVYPNPFVDIVKFQVKGLLDTHVRIEIYSQSGKLLTVIYDADLKQYDQITAEFDASGYPRTTFIYRLTTNVGMKSGVLLRTR